MRTDDVHYRESAGTGPIVLNIVPVTGAAFRRIIMNQLIITMPLSASNILFSFTPRRGLIVLTPRQYLCIAEKAPAMNSLVC